MAKEINIQNDIRAEISCPDTMIFRNNSGGLKDENGRLVRFGLGDGKIGSSDLIGVQRVTITPDMVGKDLGVFVAIEVKKPGFKIENIKVGSREDKQHIFIKNIRRMGGIAGFAISPEEAKRILLSLFLP